MTSNVGPFFNKLPQAPASRLATLVKFLSSWSTPPKSQEVASKLKDAKKRLGGMPRCLADYFKLGLDVWLRSKSKKYAARFGESWTWHKLSDLVVDEQGFCEFGATGALQFAIRQRDFDDADPAVATRLGVDDDWKFGTFSETVIRECLLHTIGATPASRMHTESESKPGDSTLKPQVAERMTVVPVTEYRHGTVQLFESSDLLFLHRFPEGSEVADSYLVGRTSASVKQFLKGEIPAQKVVTKKPAKRQPKPKSVSLVSLRQRLSERLRPWCTESITKRVLEFALPCIRFVDLGASKRAAVGGTRLGGDPDLPIDFCWPVDPTLDGRNALCFLGQLNFKELPYWKGSPFPKTGMLSLFVGQYAARESACAFYFSSRKKLKRQSTPVDRLLEDFDRPLHATRVRAELSLSLPAFVSGFQVHIDKLGQRQQDYDSYEMWQDLAELDKHHFAQGYFAQMGGYAVTPIATRFHDRAACDAFKVDGRSSRGVVNVASIQPTRKRNRVLKESLEQQLLFGIDSNNSTGAMWSDAGLLYLIQNCQQTKAKQFDSVQSYLYH